MTARRVATTDAERFYRTGALALRALQDRALGAERFGANASARWKAFAGELTSSQRLDLLFRDAAVMYPLAFAPRSIFELPGLAHDEPFGPEWTSLPPSQAGAILRDVENATGGSSIAIKEVLFALADVWGLKLATPDAGALAKINAASRLVVAGAGAVIAVAAQMSARNDCDFGDQVLLVSDEPAARQLCGIAAAISGSRKSPRSVGSAAGVKAATALGFDRATAAIVSSDCSALEVTAAQTLATELGG
jgi:hypothetical protein